MDKDRSKPAKAAVAGQVDRGVRPCAYRLLDAEASAHYKEEIYVFFDAREFQTNKRAEIVCKTLDALYDKAALNRLHLDCRICAHYTTQTGGCVSVVQCVDGAQFRAKSPRQYWIAGPNVGNEPRA